MKLEVDIQNKLTHGISLNGIKELAGLIWYEEAKCDGEILIILVDDDDLVKLNRQFLNRDYKTDVIAFPLSDESDTKFEGEIYISIDRVKENAHSFNVTPDEELKRVVAHGLLHFIGYSDSNEINKKKMHEREDYYLNKTR